MCVRVCARVHVHAYICVDVHERVCVRVFQFASMCVLACPHTHARKLGRPLQRCAPMGLPSLELNDRPRGEAIL